MRILRMAFLGLLALALITMALANREIVNVRLFPANFDAYLSGNWSASMPLFLVILLAMAVGMLLGLIWEWLRESQLRAESARKHIDAAARRERHHQTQGLGRVLLAVRGHGHRTEAAEESQRHCY